MSTWAVTQPGSTSKMICSACWLTANDPVVTSGGERQPHACACWVSTKRMALASEVASAMTARMECHFSRLEPHLGSHVSPAYLACCANFRHGAPKAPQIFEGR